MPKRDLFTELMQGFEDLQSEREGKLTLRTTVVELKPAPEFRPQDIVALRETLRYSQSILARRPVLNDSAFSIECITFKFHSTANLV